LRLTLEPVLDQNPTALVEVLAVKKLVWSFDEHIDRVRMSPARAAANSFGA
jgi:hypothetical protein